MEAEYNYPGNDRDDKQWNKEDNGDATPGADSNNKPGLEQNGPNNSKPFNVLGQDGSLADLPGEHGAGNDALEGTVGLGT